MAKNTSALIKLHLAVFVAGLTGLLCQYPSVECLCRCSVIRSFSTWHDFPWHTLDNYDY